MIGRTTFSRLLSVLVLGLLGCSANEPVYFPAPSPLEVGARPINPRRPPRASPCRFVSRPRRSWPD